MGEYHRSLVGAIDWGGSKIEVGLFDAAGEMVRRERQPSGFGAATTSLLSAAERLDRMARTVGHDLASLAGIGIAVPGMVDRSRGVLVFAPDHAVRDLDVRRLLQEHLGMELRVEIDNDVRAAARAEARLPASAGKDMLWLTVSSGVGGALVLGGAVREGANGLAGEIGHITVDPGGEQCGCGKRGCLQTVCAAPALVREAHRRGLAVTTAAEVASLCGAGDERAVRVLERATHHLAGVLAAVVTIVDVEVVTIGGGVGLGLDPSALQERIRRDVLERDQRRLIVQHTTLGPAASLVGAAGLVTIHEEAP